MSRAASAGSHCRSVPYERHPDGQVLPLTPSRLSGIHPFMVTTVSPALAPYERLFRDLEINGESLLVSLVPASSLLLSV